MNAERTGESALELTARARRIARRLARLYPEAPISLDFETPWQCLAATILSAQCTDERVNRVTPALFARCPDAAATADADPAALERIIASTGFFREKTKSLKASAREVAGRFGGRVPDTMEELVTLRGVGRKTANVVLGHAYGKPAMVVETHVLRVSRRLGLTRNSDPDRVERDLCGLIAPAEWTRFSMRLTLHGRRVCSARKPKCTSCALYPDCPRIGVGDHLTARESVP